jgi:hypothetical protein
MIFEAILPVYFVVRPTLENRVTVALSGLRKKRENGQVLWDTTSDMVDYVPPPQPILSTWIF